MTSEVELSQTYKGYLKLKLKELKTLQKYRFTSEKLAQSLGIDATYLSRCLNHAAHHPSRDLLYRIAQKIVPDPVEQELVLTLFDLNQATSPEYRNHLVSKIKLIEEAKVLGSLPRFKQGIKVLHDHLLEIEKTCSNQVSSLFI